jgi:hypothetical protein
MDGAARDQARGSRQHGRGSAPSAQPVIRRRTPRPAADRERCAAPPVARFSADRRRRDAARIRGFDAALWTGIERLVYFICFRHFLFRSLTTSPSARRAPAAIAVGLAFSIAACSRCWRGRCCGCAASVRSLLPVRVRFNTYVALAWPAGSRESGGLRSSSLSSGCCPGRQSGRRGNAGAGARRAAIALELARNPLVVACAAGIAWVSRLAVAGARGRVLELSPPPRSRWVIAAVGAGLTLTRPTLPLAALAWWRREARRVAGHRVCAGAARRSLAGRAADRRRDGRRSTATSAYVLAAQMNGHGAPVALLISAERCWRADPAAVDCADDLTAARRALLR